MPVDRWNTVLVLGGIRSGKSAFAESLVADVPSVRYVATSAGGADDQEWLDRIEAHQRRRPQSWSTEEASGDPGRLAAVLSEAKPDDTLLVDDLGGWVTTLLDPTHQPNDDVATVAALADAVRACAGRLVLVSPEVGLSVVPATPVGRAFVDALGTVNQALAAACDRVALVVAGQATWLKEDEPASAGASRDLGVVVGTSPSETDIRATTTPRSREREEGPALTAPALVPAEVTSGGGDVVFEPGMELPLPDSDAGPAAGERLATLDLPGAGLGNLSGIVEFAAATQGTTVPRPWTQIRALLVSGRRGGGAAAGADPADAARRVAELETGAGALSRLAGAAGADVAILRVSESGAMEDGPVLPSDAVDAALRQGWHFAARASQDGCDLLVLAAAGTGTEAAATAVLAATSGAEPVAVLPRVLAPGGRYDDAAWMVRCAAVRDALHRIRHESRGATDILREIGGADVALAAGVLLGAAARRIPVLLDGPLGIAAGLVARDLASQIRHWCVLATAGRSALVRQGADVLGLSPAVDLDLDLGEGANALATLPLLNAAIGLAGALPVHPALRSADPEFAEPEPAGPGPATTEPDRDAS
jgi:adenosyl cobinamide kinase/adenosyl cobinamide phosphate guanylyltransferase/NaMN:DMB phosphoribosyltransferase